MNIKTQVLPFSIGLVSTLIVMFGFVVPHLPVPVPETTNHSKDLPPYMILIMFTPVWAFLIFRIIRNISFNKKLDVVIDRLKSNEQPDDEVVA